MPVTILINKINLAVWCSAFANVKLNLPKFDPGIYVCGDLIPNRQFNSLQRFFGTKLPNLIPAGISSYIVYIFSQAQMITKNIGNIVNLETFVVKKYFCS